MNSMKIYRDPNLEHEITEDGEIRFGEVEAGLHKDITIYLFNDANAELRDIDIELPEKDDVEVMRSPTQLMENSSDHVVLRWSPSIDLRKALETNIKIRGKEVYV